MVGSCLSVTYGKEKVHIRFAFCKYCLGCNLNERLEEGWRIVHEDGAFRKNIEVT